MYNSAAVLMEPESEETREDKMSNFALHTRLRDIELIIYRCAAFLAAVGYISTKFSFVWRYIWRMFI